jgi:hypothetical protein
MLRVTAKEKRQTAANEKSQGEDIHPLVIAEYARNYFTDHTQAHQNSRQLTLILSPHSSQPWPVTTSEVSKRPMNLKK